jgi:uncharacterized protein (TIGR02271 family)
MFARTHLREGMVVRSQDGEKLGKVYAIGDDRFHIEKGLFFPKDYLCSYSDIADIRGDEVILRHGREALSSAGTRNSYGEGYASGSNLGTSATTAAVGTRAGIDTARERVTSEREHVAVPVQREELDVVKREKQAGAVRVEKHVVAEEKEIDVPVRKERVRVERRTVDPGRPAMNAKFDDETVVVPLRAEEVEVQKRAVVNEEVVIHKETIEDEKRVAETVRREEVDVRGDGQVDIHRGYGAPSNDDPTWRR